MELQQKALSQGMIDVFKFLFSILIVLAHYVTENAEGRISTIIEYGVSLYVIVVPFFFCCSGYFLFRKIILNPNDKTKIIKGYCYKIAIMYLIWSLIYLLFEFATWIKFESVPKDLVKFMLNCIFYSTYKTIWFMPALIISVCLTYLFISKYSIKNSVFIAIVLYVVGALGVSYSFIFEQFSITSDMLDIYNYIFVSTRNGLFNGFPFVMLGALIAYRENEQSKNVYKYAILTIVFGIAFVIEAFILKFIFSAINANTLFFLVPFTYYLFGLCICVPIKSNKILLWMRKMSTAIFLSQRIFLTALPNFLPTSVFATFLNGNAYIGCIYILLVTTGFAEIMILLTKRCKFLSYLY